jgi:hypothetical protein
MPASSKPRFAQVENGVAFFEYETRNGFPLRTNAEALQSGVELTKRILMGGEKGTVFFLLYEQTEGRAEDAIGAYAVLGIVSSYMTEFHLAHPVLL